MDKLIKSNISKLANAYGVTDKYQHDLIYDTSRNIIINKARGIGISTAFCFKALMKAIMPEIMGNTQKEAVILSRSDNQALHLMDYIFDFWQLLKDKANVTTREESKSSLAFSNGQRIFSISCNPAAIRTYHGDVYGDEIAHFEGDIDRKMLVAISGVLSSGGCLLLCTTPNGERGEFFRIWTKQPELYHQYNLPYTVCKREVYQKYVKAEKKKMLPMEFAQEFCCKFISEKDRAIPLDIITMNIQKDLEINKYRETDNPLYCGIDFAKIVTETCIYIFEKLENNILRTYWVETFAKTNYTEQLNYITRLNENLNITKYLIDKTGIGIRLEEELKVVIGWKLEGMNFTNSSKEKMFELVKNGLLDRKLILPNNEKLIEQIHTIEKVISAGGNVQYRHSDNKKDDMFWAMALAINCAYGGRVVAGDYRMTESKIIKELNSGSRIETQKRVGIMETETNNAGTTPSRWAGAWK